MYYRVEVLDLKEHYTRYIKCNNHKELSNLLLHLDEDKFMLINVMLESTNLEDDIKQFCKEDKNLEKGGEE